MMKNILLFVFISVLNFSIAQLENPTIYKDLEIVKNYAVSMYSQTGSGNNIYEINNKRVSKKYFEKFEATQGSMKNCKPCILVSYDENEVLLRKGIFHGDCGVGWFESYHSNGKLKIKGSYIENPTGDWTDIWNRRYCNIPIGKWSYFDKEEKLLFSEFWENGEFIKQVPEQKEIEIWDVDLFLNEVKIENQPISIDQINDLRFEPKYKNKNTYSNLNVKLNISSSVQKPLESQFSLVEFKNINVAEILSKSGISLDETIYFELLFLNDETFLKRFYLNVTK